MKITLSIQGEAVDLFTKQSLKLTREVYTKENVASTDVAYSQQITIPATERNIRLFDYVHLLDHWEKPSPHVPQEGVISVEDGTDIKAVIEIRGFTYERGEIATISIAFYIFATELFSHFGNDNIADVDLSALDFNLTQANILASWVASSLDYFCPVMAHSKPFYYLTDVPGSPVAGNIAASGTGVEVTDCKPSYSIKKIVELIFLYYGVTVTFGTKIGAHLAEAFILPSQSSGGLPNVNYGDYYTEVKVTGSIALDHVSYTVIPYDVEIADPNDNYNPITSKYTAPSTGLYSFRVEWENDTTGQDIYIAIRINGGAWGSEVISPSHHGSGTAFFTDISLTVGDLVEYGIKIGAADSINLVYSRMKTTKFAYGAWGNLVRCSELMPEMKVSEFIKGFLAGFKATLLQTGENSYKIYDTRSIYDDGTVRDWSKYVDAKVMPYQKRDAFRRLILSHAKADDLYNTVYQGYTGRRYGSINYDTGLILGKVEVKLESIFTVFPPVLLGKQTTAGVAGDEPTDLLLHQQVDQAGEPVKSNFLLFYRNGVKGVNSEYYLQNGVDANNAPTYDLQDTYGFYSANQELIALIDTPSVTYGLENPYAGEVTKAVLTYEFWRDLLEIFISNAAFELKGVPFRVPPAEMGSLKINDTIIVNGIYHLPTKVVYDYENDLVRLDLIIYNNTYPVTLPVVASGSGELTDPYDVNIEVMHSLNGRRRGERIFRPVPRDIWKPKNLT